MVRTGKIMALVLILLSACASPPQRDPKDKWVNITNAQNKVVAAFNANNGQTEYYADPKEAFSVLLGAFAQYQQTCKPVEKKAEPKKQEKKK